MTAMLALADVGFAYDTTPVIAGLDLEVAVG